MSLLVERVVGQAGKDTAQHVQHSGDGVGDGLAVASVMMARRVMNQGSQHYNSSPLLKSRC